MCKLLLASRNQGKLIEMKALLQDIPLELVTPDDVGALLDVEETAETYRENATRKAIAFGQLTGLISLADDSGLEVDALSGAPGIRSRRFSPLANATDADRRAYLLEGLKDKERPWKAHFHCTVAIYIPPGDISIAEGDCFGEIIPEERGLNGFGYDPIFFLPELKSTMAELTLEQKNRISHRAAAIRSARPILERLFLK